MKRLAALWLLLLAAPALGGNSLRGDSLVAFATGRNIGVTFYYHGDDDSDATIQGLLYKPLGSGYDIPDTLTWFRSTTMYLNEPYHSSRSCVHAGDCLYRYFTTSILMCPENARYRLVVRASDPSGATHADYDTTVGVRADNTLPELVALPKGKQVFIGPSGDDTHDGSSLAQAVRKFSRALSLMTTQGDQMVVLGGGTIYVANADTLVIGPDSMNGAGSRYYSVVGQPGATISGADPNALAGARWGTKDIAGVKVNVFDFASSPLGNIYPRTVVIDDSTRLYPYNTFFDFKTDPQHIAARVGCFWQTPGGDSVMIRAPSSVGTNLTGHTINVSRYNKWLDCRSAFWRFDSLRVQHFGRGRDNGIGLGVMVLGNEGSVVENCRFEDNARPNVEIPTQFGTDLDARTNNITLQYDTVVVHVLGQTWNGPSQFVGYDNMANVGCHGTTVVPPDSCKEANLVFPTFMVANGRGHVLRWNRQYGGCDTFARIGNSFADSIYAFETPQLTNFPGLRTSIDDMDVYGNVIIDCGDDVLEPDVPTAKNLRFYKNIILGGHDFTNFGCLRGPMYFVFNTAINGDAFALPIGADVPQGSRRGWTVFANNTVVSRSTAQTDVWAQPQNGPSLQYVNTCVWNNLLEGRRSIWYDAGLPGKNDFNWNAAMLSNDTTSYASCYNYGSVQAKRTIAQWRAGTGYETNGSKLSTLAFADSARWDWSPQAGWAGVTTRGSARSIPGINTNMRHADPSYHINDSGSSDSVYVGAWPVNGMRLSGVIGPR